MKFHVMDQTGHSTVEFDKANPVDLASAENMFNEFVSKGYAPAVKGEDGNHTLTRTFDPTAEETLFQPQLKGG